MFLIGVRHKSPDYDAIIAAVNQGIDSRLEGFTASTFTHVDGGRLVCRFADEELPILIRRLTDAGDENAGDLAVAIARLTYLDDETCEEDQT